MFTSCTQEEGQSLPLQETQAVISFYDKAGIETAELNEKLDYKSFHLTKLMEAVIRSSPDFDSQLTSKPSNGEHLGASYFSDLLSKSHTEKGGANDDIQFSLNAFTDLDGESWYPYLRKLKKGKDGNPLFLINSFDVKEEREIVQGYEPDGTGKLKLVSKEVFEEDIFDSETDRAVGNRAVYAIAIAPCLRTAVARCSGGGGGNTGSSTSIVTAKFGYMIIKDKKESWLEKAEVHKQSYSSESPQPGRLYGPCGNGCDTVGDRIRKFSNRDVRKRKKKTVNHRFYYAGNSVNRGNVVSYVIYENDHWPAHLRQYNAYVNGAQFKFRYRSYQTPYDQNTITLNPDRPYNLQYALSTTRRNNAIEYNIVR